VFKSAADNRLIPIGQPASLSSIRSRNKLNGVELLWLVALLVFKSAADNRLYPKRQQASLRSNRSRNKLNGVDLFNGLQFHFILAAATIADGSILTNHNNIPMARARYKVNHASEQALAHLFACHDARGTQVAVLDSRENLRRAVPVVKCPRQNAFLTATTMSLCLDRTV
jgi:hypothetical protein